MKEKLGNLALVVFFLGAAYNQLFVTNEKEDFLIIKNVPLAATDVKLIENKEVKLVGTKRSRYRISEKGKSFIKRHETCKLKAYNDPDPKRRSVGWGHQIQKGEQLETITRKKADELFDKDVEWVNGAINRLLSGTDKRFVYSQDFIDGLGSLIYNCGERGVTLTKFYDRLQKCRYDKNAAGNINTNDLRYAIAAVKTDRISAKGHIERRYNEHLMMLGKYI